MLECVMYFSMFKSFAKVQARILPTRAVFREGRKTCTRILNPEKNERFVKRLDAEREAAR